MTTPNQDIVVVRGDDDDKIIEFSIDVSNFDDAWFTVRDKWRAADDVSDTGAVFQARYSTGGLVAGGTDAQLRLPLPHAQTTTWGLNEYVYDVQVSASGKIFTTQRGRILVLGDATAATA